MALRSTYQPCLRRPRCNETSRNGGSTPRRPLMCSSTDNAAPIAKTVAAVSELPTRNSPHSSILPGRGRTNIPGELRWSMRSISAVANVLLKSSARRSFVAGSVVIDMWVDPPRMARCSGRRSISPLRASSAQSATAVAAPGSRQMGGVAISATLPSAITADPRFVRYMSGLVG